MIDISKCHDRYE